MLSKKAAKRPLHNPQEASSKKSKLIPDVDSFLSDGDEFEEVKANKKSQDAFAANDDDIEDVIQQSLEKDSVRRKTRREEEEMEEDTQEIETENYEAETDEFELLPPKKGSTENASMKKQENSKSKKDDKFHLSDSEESDHEKNGGEFAGEDDNRPSKNEEDGQLLEIEKQAIEEDMLQEQMKSDEKEEWKYMLDTHTARKKTSFIFPAKKKLLEEKNSPMDLKLLKKRIEDAIEILCNFKQLRDGKHNRKEYISLLSHSMARYYGYSLDLMNMLLTVFPPNECLAFVESNEKSRPVTIRCNTLKCRRRELAKNLIERGVNLDPLAEWSKEGLTIMDTQVPIGATPEYLAGYYMVQSAASLLPVMALDVKPGQAILDVAAAPGGKSTHIAQLMKNTGVLICNDVNKDRLKAVFGNIHRMGITNSIIINCDGRQLRHRYHAIFDRVLLDAPCSCLGVISRDPQIKHSKTFKDITNQSTLQQELILSAIDCLRPGGILVYSTCSISVHENEVVVHHALTNRPVKIVDTNISFGVDGFVKFKHFQFHPTMKLTKRYYPHTHNMDGFFVAKLQKTDKEKRGPDRLTLNDTFVLNGDDTNGNVAHRDKSKHQSASTAKKTKQKLPTTFSKKTPKQFRANKKVHKKSKKHPNHSKDRAEK